MRREGSGRAGGATRVDHAVRRSFLAAELASDGRWERPSGIGFIGFLIVQECFFVTRTVSQLGVAGVSVSRGIGKEHAKERLRGGCWSFPRAFPQVGAGAGGYDPGN
ncbi:hypothetical protein GCM10023205_55140 [Yinghuangia aomiensis]|uniref:Uncharacterized protein n=1 Tax=Yinghuangia aomiensis TaxID=676205 RepID=A0ABP9HVV4_9ACTN